MNLALFDFDGTITHNDTFSLFLKFSLDSKTQLIGGIRLAPYIAGYKLGWVTDKTIRTKLCQVGYVGYDANSLKDMGQEFAKKVLPTCVRENALERIFWHKQQGDQIVVVSASLGVYLESWCHSLGLDVICNQLETHNGILTGHFIDGDCGYLEKVNRIKNKYDLSQYPTIYAYGDTPNDYAMLELAHKKYYRWQEVD
ncbi:HAD-IB family hydrolase [Acinetobacter oleivorans]|uniref:HAD-IB family hydrolase n=1 Tax=Acinetobacter oleivorans TaxID=1148157 RepID=UPI001580DA08|nr:HAD-IB family hydrolase [Acinetobacter oleivorans]NUF13451.1 HAD-IB family hydrolase [Acinetobacter oleivorans]NUF35438.1 HAD-IB family hydrolase [Acinetobacter oleivorans]